eukprot:m.91886 g.91886  ORF g.91886 m.91886 type:complete len:150 (-) comp9932_c0_seq1:1900-2349(-)
MVRLKHRYLLTEIIFADDKIDASIKSGDILRAVKAGVQTAHGDYGTACVVPSLQLKYFNRHTRVMLLRVSRDHYEMLWSALTLVTVFDKRECLMRVLHVAGTIRSCQRHLLRHQQLALKAMVAQATNPVEKREMEKLLAEATQATLSDG